MTAPDATLLGVAVRDHADGATVGLRVVPRASRTALGGRYGDALKLRVHEPAVEGAANAAVRRYLADRCGVPAASVEVIRGQRSRDKVVLIRGAGAPAVRRALGRP